MRAGVEPGSFELVTSIREERGDLSGQFDGAASQQTIDVEHPESNRLEVKRRDRALERFQLLDERPGGILHGSGTKEIDEGPDVSAGRFSMIACGHDEIENCRLSIADCRLS